MNRGIISSGLKYYFFLKVNGKNFVCKSLLLISIIIFLFSLESKATHISGADVSYAWVSGNTFEIKLTLYRDCSGISAPNTVSVNYKSVSCGYNLNVTLNKVAGTGQEITQPCDSSPTVCAGGTQPGIQKYDYTANVTLPAQCSDWVFGYSICCRNCAITTLSYTPNNCTGVPATYVEATLNNLVAPSNSSPAFTNVPVAFFCIGQPFHFNHGAYDVNGDSLVYSLISPRSAASTNVVFNAGYSATSPISSSPPVSLATNGDIIINPTTLEVGVMDILVQEYRNGIIIGTVVRDMEFWTHTCSNVLPTLSGINGSTNFNIIACAGVPVSFNIFSTEPDVSQIVTMDWNYSIAGASFTTTSASRPVGTFAWTPSSSAGQILPYTFTVLVKDNNCPSNGFQTYSYSVIVPKLSAVVNATNSICATPGSGTAIAIPNGDGPFHYAWIPGGATTSSINGLIAGNYNVIVTDANGCTVNATTNITSPVSLSTSLLGITNISCNGANNGSLSIGANGGVSPYTYSWSPSGGTNATASGLSPGAYTVTISDALGCTQTIGATVNQPPLLTAVTNGSVLACNNDANGTASVTPSGGTAGYTYHWSTGETTSIITGKVSGSYTVTVTDAHGCSITKTVIIIQPPPVNISLSSTSAACGSPNGSVASIVSGGTNPYNYSWNPGGATTSSINAVVAGTYTVTVTDANGCTKSASTGVSNISGPAINLFSLTNVKCNGGNNGAATISVTGGTAPYSYQWSPSGGVSPAASGLSAGNYIVNVTDGNNCTTSTSLQINEPPPLQSNFSSSVPLCYGSSNGSASVLVSGGTPAYNYTWSTGNNHTPSVNNLAAGFYSVDVTDANGCLITASINLTQPAAMNGFVLSSIPVSCNGGNNGSAVINATGGNVPYKYLWFPCGDTLPSAAGLTAGNYTITVTDAHNCTETVQVNINQPAPLSTAITIFGNVLCAGDSSGFANVISVGGTPPFSYSWSPIGESDSNATGLSAGNYSVTTTDINGCTAFSSITIGQPSLLSLNLLSVTDVSCYGGSDGSASVTPTGGTAPYTYQWTPTGGTASIANNLTSGNYIVLVTDANGCSDTLSIFINQPSALSATLNTFNTTCFGGTDGSAAVIPSGGIWPYSYSWSPGVSTSIIATGLSSGYYTLTMTDSHGCIYTDSAFVGQPTDLNLTASTTSATCGNSNGIANVSVTGGTSGYSYFWSPVNSNSSSLTNIPAGSYIVTVDDSNGCTASATAAVSNIGAPGITLINVTNVSCSGGSDGAATINITGGFGPFTILWLPSGGSGLTATGLSAGTYTVMVTNIHHCSSVKVINITEPPPIQLSMSAFPVTCYGGNDGSISVNVSGGSGSYQYSWNNGIGNIPSVIGLPSANYSVTVTDQNACTATAQSIISQPSLLTATVNSSAPVSCYGGNDGSASVFVGGGTMPYTYNWDSTGITSATATGLFAGNYLVSVTDGAGCSAVTGVIINQPAPLIAQTSIINGTCGLSNGIASVIVSGGTMPYTYLWNQSGETTSTISGLSPGNFAVSVTDNNGCQVSTTADVLNSGMINVTVSSVTNVTCSGGNNGSAQILVSGGTMPYSFNWQPSGGNSSFANGLFAGTYNVIVEDSNNCTQDITVVINEPPSLSATVIATHIKCAGDGNGFASVIASGGTGGYTYQWLPGGLTTPSIGSLNGGNYSVEVTDGNGCTTTTLFTIYEPAPVSIMTSSTPAGCSLSNGSAIAIVTGGTPPFNYLWSPGGMQSDSVNGIPAGSYSVMVTDSNNCVSFASASVSNTAGPTASLLSSTNVSCYGGSDGSAEVSVSGGTSPCTYNWFPNGGSSAMANNLIAGSYSVTIRDSENCFTSVPVVISQPVSLNASIHSTKVICHGGSDGSALVIAGGGIAPYTYSWSSGDSTANCSGLSAGNYSLIVTDANGCHSAYSTLISEPTAIRLDVYSAPAICNGRNTGFASVVASGGTPGYTYLWSNGYTYNSGSNFLAGYYSVTVTDAHGCTADTGVTISQPPPLIINRTIQEVSCAGLHDGQVSLNVTGGIPPYSYDWTPFGGNVNNVNNLASGSYAVTVRDRNGCIQKDDIYVGSPPAIDLYPSLTDVHCFDGNDGTANVFAVGGTPPYSYFWSNGNATPAITNLHAGVYTIIVTDSNTCTSQAVLIINEPEQLQPIIQSSSAVCIGQDATLTAECSGGTPAYSYIWSNGIHANQITVSPAVTTDYNVRVTDSNGCISNTATGTVIVNPELLALAGFPDTVCEGSSVVLMSFASGGDGGPYTFSWDNGMTGEFITVIPASNTNYTVTVSDDCGTPPASASIPVIVIPNPVVDFIPEPFSGCQPLEVNFKDSSNTDCKEFYWNFGDGYSDTTKNPSHIYLNAGIYTVNHIVKSLYGCTGKIMIPAAVKVYPDPVANFTNVPEVASIYNPVINFFDASTNASHWEWDFGDSTVPLINRNPEHAYKDTGTFIVRLISTSDNGCVDTTYGKVIIKGEYAFYIPNAFTPNNDEVNDNFLPLGIGVKDYEMNIYDRWGLRIFYSDDILRGWNGRIQNGDTPCQMDVYVYKIDVVDLQGMPHHYVGHVSLVR